MVVHACGGSGPMPGEDMCVLGMGLEKPQRAGGSSPARKRAHAAHGRMSKGPRREASWFLRACWRLCDQTAGTGFTSVVEAAIPEQPCELAYLS